MKELLLDCFINNESVWLEYNDFIGVTTIIDMDDKVLTHYYYNKKDSQYFKESVRIDCIWVATKFIIKSEQQKIKDMYNLKPYIKS